MNGIGLIHLYHLVMTNSLLLKMTIEIMDFQKKHGGYYTIPGDLTTIYPMGLIVDSYEVI